MKFSYLIDTDWIIHYLNGNRDVVSKLRSLESEGLTVSVISIAELYEGIYYSTNPDGNEPLPGLKARGFRPLAYLA